MGKTVLVSTMITATLLLTYCGNSGQGNDSEKRMERIKQRDDGTLSLKIEYADCYSNTQNPSGNTAEWNVVVSKSGRYDVWLTSITTDTLKLSYENNVMVTVADNVLEARPQLNRIVRKSGDVSNQYFQADSFLGTLFIPGTGSYYVQVISEKILPEDYLTQGLSGEDISRLVSVSFTPASR